MCAHPNRQLTFLPAMTKLAKNVFTRGIKTILFLLNFHKRKLTHNVRQKQSCVKCEVLDHVTRNRFLYTPNHCVCSILTIKTDLDPELRELR